MYRWGKQGKWLWGRADVETRGVILIWQGPLGFSKVCWVVLLWKNLLLLFNLMYYSHKYSVIADLDLVTAAISC